MCSAHCNSHLLHQAGLPTRCCCCEPCTTTPAAGSPKPGATCTHKRATEPQLIPPHFSRREGRGADHLSAECISWGSTGCWHHHTASSPETATALAGSHQGNHHDASPCLTTQTADYLPGTLPCPIKGSSSFNSSLPFLLFKLTKSHM